MRREPPKGPGWKVFETGPTGWIMYHSNGVKVVATYGEGWDHVSVSRSERTPTWEEMCFVKNAFWDPEDTVLQIHPPKSKYVNNHPFCLHLWRSQRDGFKLPPTELVGVVT